MTIEERIIKEEELRTKFNALAKEIEDFGLIAFTDDTCEKDIILTKIFLM